MNWTPTCEFCWMVTAHRDGPRSTLMQLWTKDKQTEWREIPQMTVGQMSNRIRQKFIDAPTTPTEETPSGCKTDGCDWWQYAECMDPTCQALRDDITER